MKQILAELEKVSKSIEGASKLQDGLDDVYDFFYDLEVLGRAYKNRSKEALKLVLDKKEKTGTWFQNNIVGIEDALMNLSKKAKKYEKYIKGIKKLEEYQETIKL